jgi:FtsZ-interacting cell division protein ZipA
MESTIVIAVAAVLVVGLLVLLWSRRKEAGRERGRAEAAEHRSLANATGLEADKRAAAAEERAARAKREQLEAEEERIEALRIRGEANELHRKADEIDPDVDADADADGELADPNDVDGQRRTG